MQLCVCVALLLVVAGRSCSAQRPQPCSTPPFLQGRLTVVNQNADSSVYGSYSYDAIGQRIRFQDISYNQNETVYQDVLLLFQQGVMYLINKENQTCKLQMLKDSFHPMSIPNNAKFLDQVVLGSLSAPGQGLLVNTWTGEIPEYDAQYFLTFTEFGCLPVSSLYKTPETGWIVTSFFDIVLGLEDPDALIPPSFCPSTAEGTGQEGDFFSIFF